MPLYIDDEIIDKRICASVAYALKAIKYEMQDYAVTPSLALALIKKYFLPLLPGEYHDSFLKLKQVSWGKLHWSYSGLISMSFKAGDLRELLEDIAACIDWICRYTTLPPREPIVFDNLEVNIFLDIYRFLKIEVAHLRYLDGGKFDVFKACKYCWRQPVPKRKICVLHTASSKHIAIQSIGNESLDASSHFTNYKEAKRQKVTYDQTINQILTKETLAFHNANFDDPILLPTENIWSWLLERRPFAAQLIIDMNQSTEDDKIINSLLSVLHSPTNLTETLLQPYIKTNQHIKTHPQLIWLMLLRAEAWLITRNMRKSNWGGNRRDLNT
ncbi:hypothetical protein A7981_11345 [Methylovorus sp. MM2]|uniref:hypothetical protein n=1 Tax=Methylovorus sp. MM2 TaxID=1848038 RepID=UPI0007DF379A|nr:hypothetical protein [Methylovorus sp. MM2]OAM51313.1 hypothetical protein A7981_11345 [Methylovorus sp. MM2]